MISRCCCCNEMLNNFGKKKKPVTLHSGHMDSMYTDVLVGFPKDEYEDLCGKCIGAINGSSSHLNENVNSYDPVENKLNGDFDYDSIDGAFTYTQNVYEGWSD